MREGKTSFITKAQASVCHHCPVCNYGRAKPESIIGKIMHHRFHAGHCPMWNAEKELFGDNN